VNFIANVLFRVVNDRVNEVTTNRLDPGDVARIVKRRAAAAGVSDDFAGHSLRRGFITNAAKKKVPIENNKRVTGQRSNTVVLSCVAAANATRNSGGKVCGNTAWSFDEADAAKLTCVDSVE